MCDPFYVFILMANLGKGYIVWDKTARIEFVKPGKGKVQAVFEISPVKIEQIRSEIDELGKNTYWFQTEVLDEAGEVVARVEKEIYVRKKQIQPQRSRNRMKYDWILFDADNTLFDFDAAAEAAFFSAFDQFSLPAQPHYFKQYLSINKAVWHEMEKGLITQQQVRGLRFRTIFLSRFSLRRPRSF